MVKTLIGSFLAAALVGTGLVASRAASRGDDAPGRPACSDGRCEATIECKDGSCLMRWTTADGRTGEIELRCTDGKCEVVRCDPCCDSGCPLASTPATAPPGSDCCR